MKWSLMISNVQDRIDQEKISWQVNSPSSEMDIETSFLSYFMDWKSFQSEATILGWLKNVIENFCFYCETEIIGQTFEGRNMTIMKVGIIIPHVKPWSQCLVRLDPIQILNQKKSQSKRFNYDWG